MMSGSQDGIGLILRSSLHEVCLVHLIRSPDIPGSLYGLPVQFSRAGIRREQIVPSVSLENMRSLQKDFIRPVNVLHRSGHLLLHRIVFLQYQTSHIFFRHSVICYHAYHIFSAVIVMKQ